ncbi:MAG: sigma-70 family RNA polymerase sigma factor [Cytophagales bacterium]|nr:sigma-70 family RNA polymerase sigma factor [Cytophagales bacterium]
MYSSHVIYSDNEIIQAIKEQKDNKVLDALYQSILPKVKRYICSNSGNEEEAFDIFQDAVLILYKQVALNKFNTQFKIENFLFSVSKNLWINYVKRKQRMVSTDFNEFDKETPENILNEILSSEKMSLAQKAFHQLDEKCRDILNYAIYQELTMEDICIRMNISSVNAAKMQNYRCKKKLADLIKKNKTLFDVLK